MISDKGIGRPEDLLKKRFDHKMTEPSGASYRNRTNDLLITSQLLYQLS